MAEGGKTYRYFVDEAGDLTTFDKKGRSIVGQEGVSHCFMVGAAWLYEPETLGSRLSELREKLIRDPYFAGVPSMQLDVGKTARQFHAKDDTSEVRREVFQLLRELNGVEIYVAFR